MSLGSGSQAELVKRVEELYGRLDADKYFSGLPESEKAEIMESVAADLANEYSFASKLGRSELEKNLKNGLDAYDPAGFSSGIKFGAVALGKAEYDAISSALREEFRNIDADDMDPEDELFKRTAARIAGVAYTKDADAFEAALVADDRKLPAFGDAYANAEAVYYDKVGGFGGLTDIVVPEAKPKPEKGFWNWAKRHWKGLAITGMVAAAGAYGIYSVMDNTPRNQFVRAAKAKGYSEAAAGRTWDDIQKAVSNDGRISAKDAVTTDTANSMLGLGYVGNYATATRQAVANLTAAYRLGLPKLDSTSMRAITNATQLDGDIVNFQPIKVKDSTGNDVLVGSTNVQRDFWLIANLLGKYTGLAKQPEKHEWVNEMVKQVAYDGMRGDSSVSDDFLKVLYGFHEYMDALPAKIQADGLGDYVALHYLDSAKLKAEIPDRTNRTVALMCLAHIPFDNMVTTGPSSSRSATMDERVGMMGSFVKDLAPKYEELKNGFFNATARYEALKDYYDWTVDRRNNGLEFTVEKYVGLVWDRNGYMTWDEYIKMGEDINGNGLNQLLNKYWGKPWDMVKFIKGYDTHITPEVESYRYGMPLSFKVMGVPYGRFLALPYISGTSLDEWAVSVPTGVLNAAKADMGNQKIVSGYGNMVSLYSCVDGAQKDGRTMITQSLDMRGGKGDPIIWKK